MPATSLPPTAFRRESVARERPDLSTGGVIAVLVGEGGDMPSDFAFHGQVRPVLGMHALDKSQVDNAIPNNAKLVIFGGGKRLPRHIFEQCHEVLKKRRVPYVIRDNVEGVKASIEEALPKPPKNNGGGFNGPKVVEPPEVQEARAMAKRGAIKTLIAEHMPLLLKEDAQMPSAECARRLFRICQDTGQQTTLASLEQAVRNFKRDARVGERPASATPQDVKVRGSIDDVIGAMAAALDGLKKYRDDFARLEAENARLKTQLSKAEEIFNAFRSDVFDPNTAN